MIIQNFKVLALSETFSRADQPNDLPPYDGYSTWNTERSGSDKGGGGLTILYRESLVAHQWTPPVPPDLQYISNERQWLLITSQKEKCAFLHCYIACQNNKDDSFIKWNEDLFGMITKEAIQLRQQGFVTLALGDFNSRVGQIAGLEGNTPDINRNQPMFMSLITEVNLVIVNTLPIAKGLFTRFMNNTGLPGSMSLLDYGLIDNEHAHTVTTFTIDEDARFAAGSDHALLECDIVFGSHPHINWDFQEVIQYDFGEKSSFTEYQKHLDLAASSISLPKFTTLSSSEMLPHITDCINSSALKSFGLKTKKKRRGVRLPKSIITLIKTKNHLARSISSAKLQSSHQEIATLLQQLETLKANIKASISDHKLQKRRNLRSKLLLADPTRRRFWRFLKSQIKSAGRISALYNQVYFSLMI